LPTPSGTLITRGVREGGIAAGRDAELDAGSRVTRDTGV
jgi:hypothetical protein